MDPEHEPVPDMVVQCTNMRGILYPMRLRHLIVGLLSATLTLLPGLAAAQDAVRLPDLGSSAQAVLGPHKASAIGASMLHQMRARHMVENDPLVTAYINDLGYRLVAHSDDPTHDFTFFVANTQAINAFAAPGGYIGVNAGLIGLTHSEGELAAVMSHEIGHITQHHLQRSLEQQQQDAPLQALVMLGAVAAGMADNSHGHPYGYGGYESGSSNAAAGVLAAGMGLLQQRRINFTRKDEIEADRTGIETLAKSGYDPEDMADFFQRMKKTTGGGDDVPQILQSHPVTTSRIADAKARAGQLRKRYANIDIPPISREEWEKSSAPVRYLADPAALTAGKPDSHGPSVYALMRERVRALSMDPADGVDYYRHHLTQETFDTPAHRYGYAVALIRYDKGTKAQQQLEQLLDDHPDNMPMRLALANALMRTGDNSRAMDIYTELHEQSPNNNAIVLSWAKSLIRRGNQSHAQKAADLVKPLLKNAQRPQPFRTYARASYQAGNKFEAAESWANASYLSGRPFDAMEQLKRLLDNKDLDYYQRARVKSDINELRPLLKRLKKKHISTPDRPDNGDQRR